MIKQENFAKRNMKTNSNLKVNLQKKGKKDNNLKKD